MCLMSLPAQRSERRVKSKGRFGLLVNGTEAINAAVYDVSPSGICLEAETEVAIGTPVQLDGDGIVAEGVVRYCNAEGRIYRIGVALLPPTAA